MTDLWPQCVVCQAPVAAVRIDRLETLHARIYRVECHGAVFEDVLLDDVPERPMRVKGAVQ